MSLSFSKMSSAKVVLDGSLPKPSLALTVSTLMPSTSTNRMSVGWSAEAKLFAVALLARLLTSMSVSVCG